MRILLVGAGGDIGRVVHGSLSLRHEIVTAGRTHGDLTVDMADPASVAALYRAAGPLDAVISTAGEVRFAPLADLTAADMAESLCQKTLGQINLVLGGLTHLNAGGSFTLTSGVLDRDPIPMGTAAATANAALAGFVTGAAIEMPRGLRLNVVSPGLLEVSEARYGAWFAGHKPVASADVARAYIKAVEGAVHGKVLIVA